MQYSYFPEKYCYFNLLNTSYGRKLGPASPSMARPDQQNLPNKKTGCCDLLVHHCTRYEIGSQLCGLIFSLHLVWAFLCAFARIAFLLLLHRRLYFLHSNRDTFEEVSVAGFGDPYIVLNTDAHLLLFYVYARLYRKHHTFFHGIGV